MKKCPFFGVCGGCKYDFASPTYHEEKLKELKNLPLTAAPIWTDIGTRRRADFAFADGSFGLYQHKSKNIVPVRACPLLRTEINNILPLLAALPWSGSGACLITVCNNGIDIAVTSPVPYFSSELKKSVEKVQEIIRFTWNEHTVVQRKNPIISFDDKDIEYPSGAFLQPTEQSEKTLRDMVVKAATDAKKVADLFCGLGNFTFVLNADGFDINGTGIKRDLFTHPLTTGMLEKYDCVVMDPPRAGALSQCKELVKSTVSKIIYVSCNPTTWQRDADVLTRAGYKLSTLIPVDQFVGSAHWEVFSVFDR